MNLKIKDKTGKIKAVLKDDDTQPTFDAEALEDEKKKEEELKKKREKLEDEEGE
jgi:hypothetical protein